MARKVRATSLGFYGGSRRRPGDVFMVRDGFKGSWVVDVPDVKLPEKAEKPAAQSTRKARPDVQPDDLA